MFHFMVGISFLSQNAPQQAHQECRESNTQLGIQSLNKSKYLDIHK
jgi:hypothetical protein